MKKIILILGILMVMGLPHAGKANDSSTELDLPSPQELMQSGGFTPATPTLVPTTTTTTTEPHDWLYYLKFYGPDGMIIVGVVGAIETIIYLVRKREK